MATKIDLYIEDLNYRKSYIGYSVKEESTPLDVSDTTGAAPTMSANFVERDSFKAKRMRRKEVELVDVGRGTIIGTALAPSGDDGNISLDVDGRTVLLTVDRQAAPFTGTLGDYLIYLLGLVGIASGYVIDTAIASTQVVYPGWDANVWLQLKKILPMHDAEVSLVSDNIVFRKARGRITVDIRDLEYKWAVDDSGLAQRVEGYVYNNQYRSGALVYPMGGWNEDVQIYQVDARETVEFDIPLEASLISVSQPVAVDWVDRYFTASSVYSVSGGDGLPVPYQQWNDAGGSVTVKIGEDTRSLVVTVVGADIDRYAPFSIAMSAGTSDKYSSLRIVGTGVFYSKDLHSFSTGVPASLATQEVGVTVDNEFITTLSDLFHVMSGPIDRYGTSRQTIQVRTTDVNRSGDSGSYEYPTVADFEAQMTEQSITTVAQFETLNPTTTVAQFEAQQLALVQTSFINQLFGNVAGARTRRDGAWWRIRGATITPSDINYNAEADTVTADFELDWNGKTVAQFEASQWGNMKVADFEVAPLEYRP